MSNKDLLVILNPRDKKVCIDSLKNVTIPKVWISGFNERDALSSIMKIVNGENISENGSDLDVAPIYQNYILISDDVIINQKNIDVIVNNNKKYDVLTGYCNLNPNSKQINVLPAKWGNKLTLRGAAKSPRKTDYPWYPHEENIDHAKYTRKYLMENIEEDIFETYGIGFSLTSFKRHVLQEYGLYTYGNRGTGGASDHQISYRIVKDGKYKMFAHKDCYFEHLKIKRFKKKKNAKIIWEI